MDATRKIKIELLPGDTESIVASNVIETSLTSSKNEPEI